MVYMGVLPTCNLESVVFSWLDSALFSAVREYKTIRKVLDFLVRMKIFVTHVKHIRQVFLHPNKTLTNYVFKQ